MKLKTFSALLVGAIAMCGADFWNAKDPAQWTQEEIERLLNDSPWARPTNISFDLPGMQPEAKGPPGRFAGDGGYKGGAYPRRGRYPDEDEPAREPHGLPSFVATIRWESALPLQQALLRSQAATPADTSDNPYVIAVLGVPIPGNRADQASARKGGPPPRDLESVREELLASTKLIRKSKAPIAPADVKIDASKAAGEIRFYFPRKDPISIDDKELTFEMHLGRMRLEQKFHPKDMTFKRKLEL